MRIELSKERLQKYEISHDEASPCIKASEEVFRNFSSILRYGVERLQNDMVNWVTVDGIPSFVSKDEYVPPDLKDHYSTATVAVCRESLWEGPREFPWPVPHDLHGKKALIDRLTEIYFSLMLEAIKEYEQDNPTGQCYNFSKRLVYANLGVSQAAQWKTDEGFANILKAFDEESQPTTVGSEDSPLNDPLFTQFEEEYVLSELQRHVTGLGGEHNPEAIAIEFTHSLEDEQRLFFDSTFSKIIVNWIVWRDKPNKFTSNRLLAYAQDLCLFAEDLLRKKRFKGSHALLHRMVQCVFRVDLADCDAWNFHELNQRLITHFGEQDSKERSMKVLVTLRNFTSHNIAEGSGKDFLFSNYEQVIRELIRAILLIHELQ